MSNFFKNFEDLPEYFNKGEDILKIGVAGVYKFNTLDSEERYLENLTKQPIDWEYRNEEIIYDINSYGYRAPEFNMINWKESIVVFGCSITFGVGHYVQDTIPYLIGKKFNRTVVNMGIGASSNELMLYNSIMIRKKYGNPYAIVFIWSGFERIPFFGESDIRHFGSWDTNNLTTNNFYEGNISEWTHLPIRTYFTIECARQLWRNNSIYSEATFFSDTSDYAKVPFISCDNDKARDMLHPGKKSLRISVDFICNELTRKHCTFLSPDSKDIIYKKDNKFL